MCKVWLLIFYVPDSIILYQICNACKICALTLNFRKKIIFQNILAGTLYLCEQTWYECHVLGSNQHIKHFSNFTTSRIAKRRSIVVVVATQTWYTGAIGRARAVAISAAPTIDCNQTAKQASR